MMYMVIIVLAESHRGRRCRALLWRWPYADHLARQQILYANPISAPFRTRVSQSATVT